MSELNCSLLLEVSWTSRGEQFGIRQRDVVPFHYLWAQIFALVSPGSSQKTIPEVGHVLPLILKGFCLLTGGHF